MPPGTNTVINVSGMLRLVSYLNIVIGVGSMLISPMLRCLIRPALAPLHRSGRQAKGRGFFYSAIPLASAGIERPSRVTVYWSPLLYAAYHAMMGATDAPSQFIIVCRGVALAFIKISWIMLTSF